MPAGNPNWVKGGASPNPSGRPATSREWREKCQRFMNEEGGWRELVAIAKGRGDPKDQLRALQYIADHAFGKPTQVVAGPDEADDHQPLLLRFVQKDFSE